MKTLLIYYSYTGHTKELARKIASEQKAELCEIRQEKRPGTLKAYTAGCFRAKKLKTWPILPLSKELSDYDKLILMAPVWWGCPAPVLNSVIAALPQGKKVSVILVSASGKSSCREKLTASIEKRGCQVTDFKDQK